MIGGAVFFLWWQGIVFGAPRDTTKALTKMVTALAKTPAYHTEGQATLKIGPPDANTVTTQAELPDLLRGLKASADELFPSPTPPTDSEETLDSLPVIPDEAVTLGFSFIGDRVNETTSQLTISFDLSGLLALLPPTIPPSIDLDIRRMGDTVYLRLPVLSLVLGSQSNKWLAFDERDLQSLTQESLNLTKIDPASLARAIRSSERVGYERVGPVRTAHYHLTIDPLALIEVFQLKQSLDSMANTLVNLSITADIWLGTRDYLPYQYAISSHYLDQTAGVDGILTVKTILSQFGKKAAITAPREDEVIRDGLTGLLSGNFSNFEEKARDTQRKSDLSLIKSALELYKGDHGSYPSTNGEVTRSNDLLGPLKVLMSQGYLSTLPVDPEDPTSWYGYQSSDGTSNELWSIIEDETDTTAEDRGSYRIYRLQSDRAGTVTPAPSPAPGSLPTPSVSPASGSARLPATS